MQLCLLKHEKDPPGSFFFYTRPMFGRFMGVWGLAIVDIGWKTARGVTLVPWPLDDSLSWEIFVHILITGGLGFIGSNFILHMLSEHADIRITNVDAMLKGSNVENLASVVGDNRYSFVHADIRDLDAMGHVFADFEPDYVVNFAAESHVDRSIDDPLAFAGSNVMGATALMDAARAAWEVCPGGFEGRRFLQISTDEVYGPLDSNRLAGFDEEALLRPSSPYAASKAAADMMAVSYFRTYGFPVLGVRCSNNFGPRQAAEKLIPLVVSRAMAHRAIPLYGNGLQLRDWIYVGDSCRAMEAVLRYGRLGQVYNISAHNERANIDLVRTIVRYVADLTGDLSIGEHLIKQVEDRPGHDFRYGVNTGKIERELGWSPEADFDEALYETVEWLVRRHC